MTLDEAIKIGTGIVDGGKLITDKELKEFAKLGIEALKRIDHCRRWTDSTWGSPLPGETDEQSE